MVPNGWNMPHVQTDTKSPGLVRNDSFQFLLLQGQNYIIHTWTCVWGKRVYCTFYAPIGDSLHSHPPNSRPSVADGNKKAAISSVTTEAGKWVSRGRFKVFRLDCVRSPEGSAKEPILVFRSLKRILCNLADAGRSLMDLQKTFHNSLEAFQPLPISQMSLYRLPNYEALFLFSSY